VSRDERTLHPASLIEPDPSPALAHGELELLGLMPNCSNYTFLARAHDPGGGEGELAVYKPQRGEAPLWDFPDGTLCRREAAAYEVARRLGWPSVPATVLRDGPEGLGSVQRFVDHDPAQHYFTMQDTRRDEFRDVALFDHVVNNADRKAGHCLAGRDGGIHVIDHGVCFHTEPKLRTVIWDFVGEPIASTRLQDLERWCERLGREPGALAELISLAEVAAMLRRADALLADPMFPAPDSERPYPWPPV
jgi:hypothetical protein